jgi:hypothetical protein
MPRLAHPVSRFRLAAVYLTVAAALLVTTNLATLEWKQASLCGEYRDVRVAAEDHLLFVLPWIVVIICQMATIRRQMSQVIFYASFVLSLAVVLVELDELGMGWIQGNGLWMPKWLFCDQQNWVDFELLESFVTGLIIAPFAGVLALATIVVISLGYIRSAISQGPR